MMSSVGRASRSFEKITRKDLDRLASIASADRAQFFEMHPDWASLYADRHFATALCQGAALHYLYGEVGVQDFDVYSFFASHPSRRWYAKRNKAADFGDPKFGRSPDRSEFLGRRVDLLGRGIDRIPGELPARCIQRWLTDGPTESALLLAQKAVVLLDPAIHRGMVIWPLESVGAAV
jgi:hypothetical protein